MTVWVEERALKGWLATSSTGKAGRPETYSCDAILMLLVLRERFGLPLRALVGFALSLFRLMGLTLPVPCYTQICRRAQTLNRRWSRLPTKGAKHMIFTSTGLKVDGEGEGKVRMHGKNKRRTWRKLHVAIDADTQEIISFELTGTNGGDAAAAKRMMSRLSGIKSIRGDGA